MKNWVTRRGSGGERWVLGARVGVGGCEMLRAEELKPLLGKLKGRCARRQAGRRLAGSLMHTESLVLVRVRVRSTPSF